MLVSKNCFLNIFEITEVRPNTMKYTNSKIIELINKEISSPNLFVPFFISLKNKIILFLFTLI